MDLESKHFLMEIFIKDITILESLKGKANINGKQDKYILDNLKMVLNKDKVFGKGKIINITKDNGNMEDHKDMASTLIKAMIGMKDNGNKD